MIFMKILKVQRHMSLPGPYQRYNYCFCGSKRVRTTENGKTTYGFYSQLFSTEPQYLSQTRTGDTVSLKLEKNEKSKRRGDVCITAAAAIKRSRN
jgi:hypothetical protein